MSTSDEDRDALAADRDRAAQHRDVDAAHRDADAEAMRAASDRQDQVVRDELWVEELHDAADESAEANLGAPDAIAREVARGRAGLDRERQRDTLARARGDRQLEAGNQSGAADDRQEAAADRDAARAGRDAARTDRERAAAAAEQAEIEANTRLR